MVAQADGQMTSEPEERSGEGSGERAGEAGERAGYRRAPRQERSRSTVAAIFEAASRLLNEAGLETATTNRIAHVAGVSIGSLYQYFPRKEALFAALTQRAMDADQQRVREAVDRA